MNKTILISIALLFLLISGIPAAMAHNPSTNKDILVFETISDPESVDPAWAYDTASCEIIQNVYEGLITFRLDMTDGSLWNWPYDSGKIDEFVPVLATNVPSMQLISEVSPEGVEWNGRMVFTIRTGVTFQDGFTMAPADVEYSFERGLVQDRDGGPQWMLYFPLLGVYGGDTSDPLWGAKIDHAIQSDATSVWFNFNVVMPQVTMNQIFSQTWSSIVEKSWAIQHGDFDGNFAHWELWHNPAISSLDNPPAMMGTGPYKFTDWTQGISWQIDRYPGYWDGWPARVQSGSSQRRPGYVSTVLQKYNPVWTARRANFLAGTTDLTDVPTMYRDQLLGQPDVVCYYPLETLQLDAVFFNFNITATSPWVGTVDPVHRYGGDPAFPWGPDRIPLDLFSDINMRRGFSYAFNYNAWLNVVFCVDHPRPQDPVKEELVYDNPVNQRYIYNINEATYYLKLAWGGVDQNTGGAHNPELVVPGILWTSGMSFTILYNTGNVLRQSAAEMFVNDVNTLNPAVFHLTTQSMAWRSYLSSMVSGELPVFLMGWLGDYTDPDNFVFPFMHSQGTFAASQRYSNPRVDDLIEAGATTPDDTGKVDASNNIYRDVDASGTVTVGDVRVKVAGWPDGSVVAAGDGDIGTALTDTLDYYALAGKPLDLANPLPAFIPGGAAIPPDIRFPRRSIYYELQAIYYNDAPSICLVQPVGRHWTRGWVRGWYYNALYGGSLTPFIDSTAPTTPTLYAYHLFKQGTHLGDANCDGHVDVADLGWISGRWDGPPRGPAWGPPGSTVEADINGGRGGTIGGSYGPAPGIPDGSVDVIDLGLVSSYWDIGPTGPSHP